MTNKEALDALIQNGMHWCPHMHDSGHCVHVVQTVPVACKCCWCGIEYRFRVDGQKIEVHGPHLI